MIVISVAEYKGAKHMCEGHQLKIRISIKIKSNKRITMGILLKLEGGLAVSIGRIFRKGIRMGKEGP